MLPDAFLHERSDFKALVETVADSEKINDPALVEKALTDGFEFLGFRFGAHWNCLTR